MTTKTKTTTTKHHAHTTTVINHLKSIVGDGYVNTKHLNDVFGFIDGGKFMRRHLRKNFNDAHEWGMAWTWKCNDKQLSDIVDYFIVTVGVYNDAKRSNTGAMGETNPIEKMGVKSK